MQRRIHGTLHSRSPRNLPTRADLVEQAAAQGWTIERGPVNHPGEWNQNREIFAVRGETRLSIWRQMKGERVNWQEVIGVFNQAAAYRPMVPSNG